MARRPSQLQQIVETDVAELRRRLKVGEIVPARVSRVLGDGHYAIAVRGETVHAQSHLALERGVLYAVVQALRPRIRLRLVPLQSNRSAEAMIRLAVDNDLPLDALTQRVLLRLLDGGPIPGDLAAFVNDCRRLGGLIPRSSRLAFDVLLDLVTAASGEGDVSSLAVLLDLLEANDGVLPGPFTPPVDEADIAQFAWLLLRLDGQGELFKAVVPESLAPRLTRWNRLLGTLNARLENATLQLWLLPERGKLRATLVEMFSSGGVDYLRLWARTGMFGEARLELQQAAGGRLAVLGLDNSLAVKEFQRHAGALTVPLGLSLPGCRLRIELDNPGVAV